MFPNFWPVLWAYIKPIYTEHASRCSSLTQTSLRPNGITSAYGSLDARNPHVSSLSVFIKPTLEPRNNANETNFRLRSSKCSEHYILSMSLTTLWFLKKMRFTNKTPHDSCSPFIPQSWSNFVPCLDTASALPHKVYLHILRGKACLGPSVKKTKQKKVHTSAKGV